MRAVDTLLLSRLRGSQHGHSHGRVCQCPACCISGPLAAFTFSLNGTGAWTFTLADQLDHPSLNDLPNDDTENGLMINLRSILRATDFDSNTAAAAANADAWLACERHGYCSRRNAPELLGEFLALPGIARQSRPGRLSGCAGCGTRAYAWHHGR
jgi:hypothetical protein